MRIIPAILTSDQNELINQLNYISEFTDEVDIDVMDNIFVPHNSITIEEIPILSNIIFNFDLMVQDPESFIQKIIIQKSKGLRVDRIFVHIESKYDLEKICQMAKDNFNLGFSLTIPTAIENFIDIVGKVKTYIPNKVPALQLKTVQIGGQGNPYHPEVLGKISKARTSGFNGDIYIDGGMDPDTIMSIKNYEIAGVSVGAYISKSSDPMRAYTQLRNATWKSRID